MQAAGAADAAAGPPAKVRRTEAPGGRAPGAAPGVAAAAAEAPSPVIREGSSVWYSWGGKMGHGTVVSVDDAAGYSVQSRQRQSEVIGKLPTIALTLKPVVQPDSATPGNKRGRDDTGPPPRPAPRPPSPPNSQWIFNGLTRLVHIIQDRFAPTEQLLRSGDQLKDGNRTYVVGDMLGSGTFAEVYAAKYQSATAWQTAALKVCKINPDPAAASYYDDASIEAELMAKITARDPDDFFPYVKLHSRFDHRVVWGKHTGQKVSVIVTPRYGVDLLHMQDVKRHRWQLPQVARMTYELCSALAHLHCHRMVHTDLKMENVLLRNGTSWPDEHDITTSGVVLVDCGCLVNLDEAARDVVVGTRHYRAPEILYVNNEMQWGAGIDVWACGILMIEVFTTKLLFDSLNNRVQMEQIAAVFGIPETFRLRGDPGQSWDDQTDYDYGRPRPKRRRDTVQARRLSMETANRLRTTAPGFWILMTTMLNPDPKIRSSAEQVCNSLWIRETWPGAVRALKARGEKIEQYGGSH